MNLFVLFIDPKIALGIGVVRGWFHGLRSQHRRNRVEFVVQLGVVIRRAGNNQRRARLVNQNRVNLIDNRVV